MKRSMDVGKEREAQVEMTNNQLRHKLLDVEARLNHLQNEKLSLQHQVGWATTRS